MLANLSLANFRSGETSAPIGTWEGWEINEGSIMASGSHMGRGKDHKMDCHLINGDEPGRGLWRVRDF